MQAAIVGGFPARHHDADLSDAEVGLLLAPRLQVLDLATRSAATHIAAFGVDLREPIVFGSLPRPETMWAVCAPCRFGLLSLG